jgi:hypothetical protein
MCPEKYFTTAGLKRMFTGIFVGRFCGPRWEIVFAISGKTSENGLALAKSFSVHSGLSETASCLPSCRRVSS